jgi:hypothetical protein
VSTSGGTPPVSSAPRDKLGGVGSFLGRVADEPSSTRAWQQGANGEVRVGARLEKLLDGTAVRLLHDRRVPGQGQANIDHIAVGPADITVIDAKTHRGRIRRDRDGGVLSERRTILRINGRDQTKLISGVENQIAHVHAALADLDVAQEIDVRGALCFPNVDGLPLFGQIEIRRIIVDGPRRWPELPHARAALSKPSLSASWAMSPRLSPLPERPCLWQHPRDRVRGKPRVRSGADNLPNAITRAGSSETWLSPRAGPGSDLHSRPGAYAGVPNAASMLMQQRHPDLGGPIVRRRDHRSEPGDPDVAEGLVTPRASR